MMNFNRLTIAKSQKFTIKYSYCSVFVKRNGGRWVKRERKLIKKILAM
jgi:hypothetical protein